MLSVYMATEPPSGFLGLPIELLTEVLKILPWRDVLHMRETCRLLFEATKTREIWVELVQEHISSTEIPPHLERPIETHSSIELERLFLLWKSADIGWKKDDGHPAIVRSFVCEPAEFTHLIDGGRWYLVTSTTGSVTYYDLEAETITGVQLIPQQYPQGDFRVALEIDKVSPVLKFNMAFSSIFGTPSTSTAPKRRYHAIYVWNIGPVINESGRLVGLFASRVATFPHRPRLSTIHSLSLRGSHIAFACADDQAQGIIVVVDWVKADGNSHHSLRIVDTDINYSQAKTILLPENRLLLILMPSFSLYNYSDVKESTEPSSDNQDVGNTFVWHQDFPSFRVHRAVGVFPTGTMVKVVISGSYQLYAFSINTFSNEPTPVFDLIRYPQPLIDPPACALGSTRGIVYEHGLKTCMLIAYTLPDGGEPSSSFLYKFTSPDLPRVPYLLDLDEETGRIVLTPRSNNQAYVMDYALTTAS